jgi:hypothetical protein
MNVSSGEQQINHMAFDGTYGSSGNV